MSLCRSSISWGSCINQNGVFPLFFIFYSTCSFTNTRKFGVGFCSLSLDSASPGILRAWCSFCCFYYKCGIGEALQRRNQSCPGLLIFLLLIVLEKSLLKTLQRNQVAFLWLPSSFLIQLPICFASPLFASLSGHWFSAAVRSVWTVDRGLQG